MHIPRVTRTTHGKAYGRDYIKPYTEVWSQPIHRWLIARAYHRWDRRTWRLMGWLDHHFPWLARKDSAWLDENGEPLKIRTPLYARQDLRCYHLAQKGRKTLSMTYERKIPREPHPEGHDPSPRPADPA